MHFNPGQHGTLPVEEQTSPCTMQADPSDPTEPSLASPPLLPPSVDAASPVPPPSFPVPPELLELFELQCKRLTSVMAKAAVFTKWVIFDSP
jgi:hypothetical protein